MTGLKGCKSFQENVSFSLAKRKLAEKNFHFLVSQLRSCMLPYTTQIAFLVPYLEYDFMIAKLVRLNVAVLKISETSQEHNHGGVLC